MKLRQRIDLKFRRVLVLQRGTFMFLDDTIAIPNEQMGDTSVLAGIVIGNDLDWPKIKKVVAALEQIGVGFYKRQSSKPALNLSGM